MGSNTCKPLALSVWSEDIERYPSCYHVIIIVSHTRINPIPKTLPKRWPQQCFKLKVFWLASMGIVGAALVDRVL
eukprot:69956-Amphidinium_carterae.1